MSHHQALPTSRRPIPSACAGDATGMQPNTTYPAAGGGDREQLDRQITEMYRDVANEPGRDLPFPIGRPLAETLGMDVFAAATQVGPGGSVVGVEITPEQLAKSERRRRDEHVSFGSERAQRTSDKYDAHSVSLLALKPVPASRHISNPSPGRGVRVAQAIREEGSTKPQRPRRSK
jgi:hypothetical protein